ncbi:protein Mpv17 [Nematocida displodere]|uniref:Protein Mpv17 n=1 Tax=Nematocida displodere TaxID=1805483 RepID=A0A177EKP5_9MICR|nr:protein Mpv17 [Nematocida displodere]
MHKLSKPRGIIGKKLKRRAPLVNEFVVQGLIAGGIQCLADVLGQLIVGRGFSLFTPAAMAMYGFVTGSLCYTIYQKVDQFATTEKTRFKTAFYMMLVDQLIWSPFSTLLLVVYASMAESRQQSYGEVFHVFISILINSYKIWPLVQLLNFMFVPLRLRVPLMGTVSLFWNAYVKVSRNK